MCICLFIRALKVSIAMLDTTGLFQHWLTVWFCTHNALCSIGFYSHATCLHSLFSPKTQRWILNTFPLIHSLTHFLTVSPSVRSQHASLIPVQSPQRNPRFLPRNSWCIDPNLDFVKTFWLWVCVRRHLCEIQKYKCFNLYDYFRNILNDIYNLYIYI